MKVLAGFAASGLAAVVFVTVVTIGGEMHAPLKEWLAGTFTHHWVGKGIIAAGIFFLGGVLLAPLMPKKDTAAGLLYALVIVSVIGAAALVLYFIAHSLGTH